jgi:hypothetical protein
MGARIASTSDEQRITIIRGHAIPARDASGGDRDQYQRGSAARLSSRLRLSGLVGCLGYFLFLRFQP